MANGYRNALVQQIKDAGQELINRAESMVHPENDLITDFSIVIHFEQHEVPIIEMICDWWAFSWIKGDLSEMFAWYKDHADYIKLHNNTRSIVEEILEIIRTKLTEVENAEN